MNGARFSSTQAQSASEGSVTPSLAIEDDSATTRLVI
jgi:hypothetical protein